MKAAVRTLALLLVLSPAALWGQTDPQNQNPNPNQNQPQTPGTATTPGTGTPVPPVPAIVLPPATAYADQEFEPWMLDLRRAEIIAIGSFPLVYLLAGLGYDYFYYLGTGFPQDNIPWPLGPGTSRWVAPAQSDLLDQKNLTLVGFSALTGVVLAGVDWWLGR